MRRLLATLLALVIAGSAQAQGLSNLNPNTVIGRLGAGTAGPAQAIPFSAFGAAIVPFLPPLAGIIVTVRSSSAATVTASATTDYFFCLDPTSNAINLNLPATPALGLTYLVKDCTGHAQTNNITITPASGNIDGASTFVLNTNFQSIAITFTGVQWSAN